MGVRGGAHTSCEESIVFFTNTADNSLSFITDNDLSTVKRDVKPEGINGPAIIDGVKSHYDLRVVRYTYKGEGVHGVGHHLLSVNNSKT